LPTSLILPNCALKNRITGRGTSLVDYINAVDKLKMSPYFIET